MDCSNAVAIVTGGGSGLGEATSRALAGAGAAVSIFDVNAERGAALAEELGEDVTYSNVDVTDDEAVGAAVAEAAARGALRIVVNCAGMGAGLRTIDKTGKPHSRRVWQKVMDINLLGSFQVMTHAASHISQTEPVDDSGQRGVIVNTASVAAIEGQIGQLAYAASKGAIVSMTIPAARDLADVGIRVCTIAPGLFDTPMLASLNEPARQALAESVVSPKRLGTPAEYAKLVMAIVDNDYLNGETIRLDGALRMAPR
jgi:NAD(P)-dependent dehydrogenase (short-subunit alcohol dehydrogenase family)